MSNPKSISEIQQIIIDDFEFLEDWTEKYNYIIDLGKELAPLDEQYKIDENKVKGCQSQVWLHSSLNPDGTIEFLADSDAIITKGLIAMVTKVFTNQSPADILKSELTFIEEIGLHSHLSPTRSNGLASMIKLIKIYASAYQSKLSNV